MHTDPDYHLRAIAWRALAALQEHEERKGFIAGPASKFPSSLEPPVKAWTNDSAAVATVEGNWAEVRDGIADTFKDLTTISAGDEIRLVDVYDVVPPEIAPAVQSKGGFWNFFRWNLS